jgi:sodium/pantothenate symporter
VIYTTVGGYKAVAITDAIQGIIMMIATVVLLGAVVKLGGGYVNVMETLKTVNPSALEPTAGGSIGKPFILSFWVLVGFGVLGLPQTTVRGMGFKDSKSLHNAMLIGTFVVGFLMLGMHLVGVFGATVLVDGVESADLVIPILTISTLPPLFAGIFIAGPLAAIMSTVDSMLILASAAIIKDLYMNYSSKEMTEKKAKNISYITTAVLGAVVFFFALNPPTIIVWINLFAFGGLEAAFLCPTIFGLYWRRANAAGAVMSFVGGVGSYVFFTIAKVKIIGMHQIVPTILIAVILFVIGSFVGKKTDEDTLKLFFGE